MDDLEKTVACIEMVRDKYSDQRYQELIQEILVELEEEYKKHIEKKREQYRKIDSFQERKVYYDTVLKDREQSFASLMQKIKDQKAKPAPYYESWLTLTDFAYMKTAGYRKVIKEYVAYNLIIKCQLSTHATQTKNATTPSTQTI